MQLLVYRGRRRRRQGGQRIALGPRQSRLRPQELRWDAVPGPRVSQANGVAALQGHDHAQARQVLLGALAQLAAVDVLLAKECHVRRAEVGVRQQGAQVGAGHVVESAPRALRRLPVRRQEDPAAVTARRGRPLIGLGRHEGAENMRERKK